MAVQLSGENHGRIEPRTGRCSVGRWVDWWQARYAAQEGVLVRRGLKQPACIAVVIASQLIGSLALAGRSDVVGALQAVF